MATWTREQTLYFMELLEQFPILYNVKHHDYMNRAKRERCLEGIAQRLEEKKPGIKVGDLKAKIKTLRSQYLKEKASVKQSKRSGAGADDVYSPRLWCFDNLKFLDCTETEVEMESNISFPKESSTSENIEDTPNEAPLSAPENESTVQQPQRAKKTKLEQKILKSLECASDLIKNVNSTRQTPFENTREGNFGKIVEMEMKELSDDIFFEAKWKIMEIIHEAQKKEKDRKKSATTICHCAGQQTSSSTFAYVGKENISPAATSTPRKEAPISFAPSPIPSTYFTEDNSSSEYKLNLPRHLLPRRILPSPPQRSASPSSFKMFSNISEITSPKPQMGKPQILRVEVLKKPTCTQTSSAQQEELERNIAVIEEVVPDTNTLQLELDSILDDEYANF